MITTLVKYDELDNDGNSQGAFVQIAVHNSAESFEKRNRESDCILIHFLSFQLNDVTCMIDVQRH